MLAEALYKQGAQQHAQGAQGANGTQEGAGTKKPPGGDGDNVVDAEYEEVRDNK